MLSNADKKKFLSGFDINKTDYSNEMKKILDEVLALLKKNYPLNSE